MIKSLQNLMSGLESKMDNMLKQHIHHELQDFIQIQLREPFRKANKHKNKDRYISTSSIQWN